MGFSKADYARLVRAGKIRPRPRKLSEIAEADSSRPARRPGFKAPPEQEQDNPVYQQPDSWEAPTVVQKGVQPEQDPPPMRKQGPKRKPSHKRRGVRLSVSVSEEEEFILRKHAYEQGETFSAWARQAMFKSAGVPIPDRK
jgi:hypothetical protein